MARKTISVTTLLRIDLVLFTREAFEEQQWLATRAQKLPYNFSTFLQKIKCEESAHTIATNLSRKKAKIANNCNVF